EVYQTKRKNCLILSREDYDKRCSRLKLIAKNGPAENNDYRLIKKYEIKRFGATEKLGRVGTDQFIVHKEEFFDVLNEAHSRTGPGQTTVRCCTVMSLQSNDLEK